MAILEVASSAKSGAARDKVAKGPALEKVSVAAPGHSMRDAWDGVTGATAVEVSSASVTIAPELAVANQQLVVTDRGSAGRDISIASGRRLLALSLEGLKRVGDDGVETSLSSSTDLGSEPRLVVSAPDLTTFFAVPAIGARGGFPRMFAGASFSGGVLNLPQLDARVVRIRLTKNEAPDEWENVEMKLNGTLNASVGTPSTDLQLIGPDNAMLWAFPGEMPAGTAPINADVRIPIQTALNKALKSRQPLEIELVLRGTAGSEASVRFSGVSGALVRAFPGILATTLVGDPTELALPTPVLAAEAPGSAVADLTVRYLGLRVLPISDAPPAAGGASGVVVASESVVRAFPPAGLGALPLARVGLIGRAPVECELSAQIVDLSSGAAGKPLAPPGVIKLPPGAALGTVWIDLPPIPPPPAPAGLAVRANLGRFFWASGVAPLLRFAVRDPDPGGRPLRLGGAEILNVTDGKTHLPARALPAALFRNAPPRFSSDLFLTVELSDLQLRYPR